MADLEESLIINSMQVYEGFTVEEARLSYKSRENLPDSAFCGPNRTYPAHDAVHVKNGLARLAQFGKENKSTSRIFSCLTTKAKKMGIEIEESLEDSILSWYIKEYVNCKECKIK